MTTRSGDSDKSRESAKALVQEIQASMLEGAQRCSPEMEEDLRDIIRITVEFHECLQELELHPDRKKLGWEGEYCIETVFSGIFSFTCVCDGYDTLLGSTASTLEWDGTCVRSLKDQFEVMFDALLAEKDFKKQCRLLLDLYKIQIVLAGMLYG